MNTQAVIDVIWDTQTLASLLGITIEGVRKARTRGQIPRHDGLVGHSPYWVAVPGSAIVEYVARRAPVSE